MSELTGIVQHSAESAQTANTLASTATQVAHAAAAWCSRWWTP